MAAGIAYVPEERKALGLFLDRSVEDNLACACLFGKVEGGRSKDEGGTATGERREVRGEGQRLRPRELAEDYSRRLSIKARDFEQEVSGLSGGNQQKVLLGRWMATQPKVLIVDEPTRGVDIGAKGEIHRMLRAYAEQGAGVIVVSSEMPELLGLCDRILVMREGRVVGEVQGPSMTEERLIELAMGRG
jgi:ribose transport system ATP-binding protein